MLSKPLPRDISYRYSHIYMALICIFKIQQGAPTQLDTDLLSFTLNRVTTSAFFSQHKKYQTDCFCLSQTAATVALAPRAD